MYNELFEFRQKWDGVWRRRYMNACSSKHKGQASVPSILMHFTAYALPAIYFPRYIFLCFKLLLSFQRLIWFMLNFSCNFDSLVRKCMDGGAVVCVCVKPKTTTTTLAADDSEQNIVELARRYCGGRAATITAADTRVFQLH